MREGPAYEGSAMSQCKEGYTVAFIHGSVHPELLDNLLFVHCCWISYTGAAQVVPKLDGKA